MEQCICLISVQNKNLNDHHLVCIPYKMHQAYLNKQKFTFQEVRCQYCFKKLSSKALDRHLGEFCESRKEFLKLKLDELDSVTWLSERYDLFIKKGKKECEFCDMEFVSTPTLNRHLKKSCKVKNFFKIHPEVQDYIQQQKYYKIAPDEYHLDKELIKKFKPENTEKDKIIAEIELPKEIKPEFLNKLRNRKDIKTPQSFYFELLSYPEEERIRREQNRFKREHMSEWEIAYECADINNKLKGIIDPAALKEAEFEKFYIDEKQAKEDLENARYFNHMNCFNYDENGVYRRMWNDDGERIFNNI